MNKTPIEVLAIGFSPKNLDALELMLKGPGKGRYTLQTGTDPKIALVDVDGPDGQSEWQRFSRQHPKLAGIVLSVTQPNDDNLNYVKKPIHVDELLKAMRLVVKEGQTYKSRSVYGKSESTAPAKPHKPDGDKVPHLSATFIDLSTGNAVHNPVVSEPIKPSTATREVPLFEDKRPAHAATLSMDSEKVIQCCGKAEDLVFDDKRPPVEAFWEREGQLLEILKNAAYQSYRYRTPVEVSGLQRPLFFFPNSTALVGLADGTLRSMCVMTLKPRSVAAKQVNMAHIRQVLKDIPMEYQALSQETLFWKLTLWSARGRLPVGMNPRQAYELSRWPNMTRLLLPPNAMPIAAYLFQFPDSALGTCSALGLEQRFVFSFFSAAHEVGLLNASEEAASTHTLPQPAKQRGIFQRILGRIGF